MKESLIICKKCGKELPDGAKFCTGCGAPVSRENISASEPEPERSTQAEASAVSAPETDAPSSPGKGKIKRPKAKNKPALIAVFLIAALVIGVGGFFGFRTFQVNKEYKEQIKQAEEYMEEEEYGKAAARYKAALELKPEKVEAIQGLADAYFGQGRYDRAEKNYQAVLEKESKNTAALLGLANIYANTGDKEKASENYQAVLNLEPNQIDAVLGLTYLYLQDGDFAKASEALKAAQPDPGDETYARYQYLKDMSEFRPEIKELDTSGFPEMVLTIAAEGGAKYLSQVFVEISENGVPFEITDRNETPDGIEIRYTTEQPSQDEERVVKAAIHVNDLTFGAEGSYTAFEPVKPARFLFAAPYYEDSHIGQGIRRFAEAVSERSGGVMNVEVSWGYNSADSAIMIRSGADFALLNANAYNAEYLGCQDLAVFEMPYIFRDMEHMHEMFGGELGEHLIQSVRDEVGIQLLRDSWSGYQTYYFTSGKEIRTPGDMRGLRIRTATNGFQSRIAEALGAIAESGLFSDVYYALMDGYIDGADLGADTISNYNFNEVGQYLLVDNHSMYPVLFAMNADRYDSLSTAQKRVIEEAAHEAALYQRELYKQQETDALAELEANGVKITYCNDDSFKNAAASVIPELTAGMSEKVLKLVGLA